MGEWRSAEWSPEDASGLSRADRRGGTYRTYYPDHLCGSPLALPTELDAKLARVERNVRKLQAGSDLAGIARFLLRSEAIASSRIEGIAPSARNIAFAELAEDESIPNVSEQARLVAQNMTIVRDATSRLVSSEMVTVDDVVALHSFLLRDQPHLHNIRSVQNWIGGSSRTPIGADFVPPTPGEVPALMADLLGYLNGAGHSPIVQAALVHAQFETIHPFVDGNGRVGRALVHTVLTRRGLTRDAVLPVSLVLSTLRTAYINGLTSYRFDGPPEEASKARITWIDTFTDAVSVATEQASQIGAKLAEIRRQWTTGLDADRKQKGNIRALRSDSATAAVLADLPSTPVLTTNTVMRMHDVSNPAAIKALDELTNAGILTPRKLGPRAYAWVANDILDLITRSERQLASTQFDTRVSPPSRRVAAHRGVR